GSVSSYLDTPFVTGSGRVVVGCYGGHTGTGADKNEDGALAWCDDEEGWEFAALMDAHGSAESAALVLSAIQAEEQAITQRLSKSVEEAFADLQCHLISLFRSDQFRSRCREIRGETACLICARKAQFLWWLSIGDCVVYLFHAELAALGQFALNQ